MYTHSHAGVVRAGLQPGGGVPGGVREDVAAGELPNAGPQRAGGAGQGGGVAVLGGARHRRARARGAGPRRGSGPGARVAYGRAARVRAPRLVSLSTPARWSRRVAPTACRERPWSASTHSVPLGLGLPECTFTCIPPKVNPLVVFADVALAGGLAGRCMRTTAILHTSTTHYAICWRRKRRWDAAFHPLVSPPPRTSTTVLPAESRAA